MERIPMKYIKAVLDASLNEDDFIDACVSCSLRGRTDLQTKLIALKTELLILRAFYVAGMREGSSESVQE